MINRPPVFRIGVAAALGVVTFGWGAAAEPIKRWQGAGPRGEWHDALGWAPASVPTEEAVVVIDDASPLVITDAARARQIRLGTTAGAVGTMEVHRKATLTLTLPAEATGAGIGVAGLVLGDQSGARGELKISGRVVSQTRSHIGGGGEGTMTVESGGSLQNYLLFIGVRSGSRGAVVVRGEIQNINGLAVGEYGEGKLTIEAGGYVMYNSRWGIVASYPEAVGRIEVAGVLAGAGERSDLVIANAGTGSALIRPGGRIVGRRGVVGYLPTARGEATVAGDWNMTDDFIVAHDGRARFTLEAGGTVESRGALLAQNPGATAAAIIAGKLTCSQALRVALGGNAVLTIEPAGEVTAGAGIIAGELTGEGRVVVRGRWISREGLLIAERGVGRLAIEARGRAEFTGGDCLVGALAGASGTVEVVGELHGEGDLRIGYGGSGALQIGPGGRVTTRRGWLAVRPGTSGVAVVAGEWTNAGDLTIGAEGDGTLTIERTGRVRSAAGRVATGRGARGEVQVQGRWENSGALAMGGEGVAAVEIARGGVVAAAGTRLEAGSTLTFTGGRLDGGLNVAGGTVTVRTEATLACAPGEGVALNVERAGTLLIEAGARVTLDCSAAGNLKPGNYDVMKFAPGATVRGLTAERVSVTGLPAEFSGDLIFSETAVRLQVLAR